MTDRVPILNELINGTSQAKDRAEWIKGQKKALAYLKADLTGDFDVLYQDKKELLLDQLDLWIKAIITNKKTRFRKGDDVDDWRPVGWSSFITKLKGALNTSDHEIENPIRDGITHRFICGDIKSLTHLLTKKSYGTFINIYIPLHLI